jgi:hypothetical protein
VVIEQRAVEIGEDDSVYVGITGDRITSGMIPGRLSS